SRSHGEKILVREVLDRGATRIRSELADEPAVRGALLHVLGTVYSSLGLLRESETLLGEALQIRREHSAPRDVAQTLLGLARLAGTQGSFALAEQRLAEANRLVTPGTRADNSVSLTVRPCIRQVLRERGDPDGAGPALG